MLKLTLLILLFSLLAYPAVFSNDIYSYIFYSKILVVYKKLPWFAAPADFPMDELFQTIHWKGDPSRYGPVWIIFSSISFILSFGSLTLAMWNLKLAFYGSYLATLYVLSKISEMIRIDKKLVLLAFITNPLIIIEYLINPHADVVMNLFALILVFFTLKGTTFKGVLMWGLSIATKIVTAPLILGIFAHNFKYFKNSPEKIIKLFLFLSFIGSVIISYKWSLNPWYLSLPIVIMTLLTDIKFYRYLTISLSTAALARYLPLIFMGYFPPDNKIRRDLFLILSAPFVIWFGYKLVLYIQRNGFGMTTVGEFMKVNEII